MEFALEKIDDVVVVNLPGDVLDANNSPEFKQNIAPVLEENRKVVFDMGQMRFIDSSGCGALLSCLRSLRGQGGELRLCGVSDQVGSLFKLIRLDQILGVFGSREEAIRAVWG